MNKTNKALEERLQPPKIKKTCRRPAATICSRPLSFLCGRRSASRRRADRACSRFPRSIRSHAHRCSCLTS